MSTKRELLELIMDLAAMALDYHVSPFELRRRMSQARYYGMSYRSTYVALDRLEKQGLLKKKKHGRYIKFKITEAGKRFLKQKVRQEKRRDGMSTVVMFDIPEDKHGARDAFRRYLLRNDFIALQKSVMIGPCRLSKEALSLAEELGIKNYLTVLSAKSIALIETY